MISNVNRLLGRSRSVISDAHPVVDRTLSVAVRYYATARIEEARVLGSIRYDAPIEPDRLYDVDPQRIDRTVSWTDISANRKSDEHPRFRQPKYLLAGRIFEGEWDTIEERFTDSTIYRSFQRHFEQGVCWEQTEFYTETLAAIEAGGTPWDCRSRSDVDRRCEQLDSIYERIETDGYRTQNELHEFGNPNTSPHRLYRMIWSEIGVNIGRDGAFIFQDGRNRLAMAKLLDLETVPVVILVRHREWQRKRDRVARGELKRSDLPERLREHPDLVELF